MLKHFQEDNVQGFVQNAKICTPVFCPTTRQYLIILKRLSNFICSAQVLFIVFIQRNHVHDGSVYAAIPRRKGVHLLIAPSALGCGSSTYLLIWHQRDDESQLETKIEILLQGGYYGYTCGTELSHNL